MIEMMIHGCTWWYPSSLAKLVPVTPMSLWFVVDISNYHLAGVAGGTPTPPKRNDGFVRENPNLKWMITRETPPFEETLMGVSRVQAPKTGITWIALGCITN